MSRMSTKSAKSVKSVKPEEPKMNIPSAIRETPTIKAAPASTDMLAQFMTGVTPVAPKKAGKEKPTLDLTPAQQELAMQVAEAKVLDDLFETNSKNLSDLLKGDLWPLFLRRMWQQHTRPGNPILKTFTDNNMPDCEILYQVKATFSVQSKDSDELINMLVASGLKSVQAEKLVAENINFMPKIFINFDELRYGKWVDRELVESTPIEKAIADHALALLSSVPNTPPLSPEEKAVLISQKPQIKVTDGFLDRLCGYIDAKDENTAIKILTAVLAVIKPQVALSGVKYGISDAPIQRNDRLINGVRRILGITADDDARMASK
jgi:hypothetical protein